MHSHAKRENEGISALGDGKCYLAPKLLLGSVSLDNALFIEIGIPKQELGNEKLWLVLKLFFS